MSIKPCHECGCEVDGKSVRCYDCFWKLRAVQSRAAKRVQKAVRLGLLPDLRLGLTKCKDCDRLADRWEHRDYLNALEVDPVCWHCNRARGPAVPCLSRMGLLEIAA